MKWIFVESYSNFGLRLEGFPAFPKFKTLEKPQTLEKFFASKKTVFVFSRILNSQTTFPDKRLSAGINFISAEIRKKSTFCVCWENTEMLKSIKNSGKRETIFDIKRR